MIASRKPVFCPVGDHVQLGYLVKGEVCSYVCRECSFMFTWNRDGKLMPPLKVDLDSKTKKARRYCGPDGCVCRD